MTPFLQRFSPPPAFLLISILALCAMPIRAQSLTQFAPLEWMLSASTVADEDVSSIILSTQRAVPVYTLLPQSTADSRFDVLRVRAGARLTSGTTDFRYALTALAMDIQRTPQHAALTLLDYDRAGLQEVRARWFQARYGPALSMTRPTWQASLRAGAFGGLSTIQMGPAVFPSLPAASETETTWEAGAEAHAAFNRGTSWSARISGSYSFHSVQGDLRMATLAPVVRFRLRPSIRLDAGALMFRGERDGAFVSGVSPRISILYSRPF